MSGYLGTSAAARRPADVLHRGPPNSNDEMVHERDGAETAALLQQLAMAAVQNQGANKLQGEDVARLGFLLAQLATGGGPTPDGGANNNGSAGETNPSHAADDESMASSFKRSLFQWDTRAGAAYCPSALRSPPTPRPSPQPQPPLRISEHEQRWYAEERALLRELVVLTMRHSDGALLRYLPSEEEQAQMWDTHGHPAGERFAPHIVAEGVRPFPHLEVLPQPSDDENDGADGGRDREDLAFRSQLQLPLLGSGARDAIALCGECGWLYGRVSSYVASVLEDDADGVQCATARALAARLDKELAGYHAALAGLEGELPPLELSPEAVENPPQAQYLTLRSLVARTPPMRDHLRTLALLAEGAGARNLQGGKLLAAVLRHSLDGHTKHAELVRSIAADCAAPWYRLLSQWLAQGVLEDPHSEFFVREVRPDEVGGTAMPSSGFFTWHQRYLLVEGLIPLCSCGGLMDVITLDLAREVLLVGKGINFIRYCLQDREWEVAKKEEGDTGCGYATLRDAGDGDDERRCVTTLHAAVMQSSARIHSHILESLEARHHLTQHLLALKHFLFLGQGDFVSSFVEGLDQEFRGRTSLAGIYNHTLAAVLEGSLNTTNARFLPNFVLGNLRARLMVDRDSLYSMGPPPKKATQEEMAPWKDGDASSIQDPWDFIYLDYKINSPLDAIVHESANETYHRVFLFLFRLKRVEWMLNNSWRQSTALNHAILIETKAGGADAPTISEAAEHASYLLRRISSTRQTMLHFVSNLQNYLMFEVLEGGWEGLVGSLRKARTLDDVIRAHDSYLNEIADKALLSNGGGEGLERLLQKLLSIALTFGKFQDHIFSNSLAGLDKAAKIRKQVEERAEKGDWGRTTLDKEEGRVFLYLADAKLFEFVERSTNEFDRALSELLKMMSKQIDEVDCNPVLDDDQEEVEPVKTHDALPFLLFRLDFSGYYARKAQARRKKAKQSS
ncbi:hypothetical protein ACHAXT_006650 [Thalassiosira profunda]